MKNVIHLPKETAQEENIIPVQLTHVKGNKGWSMTSGQYGPVDKIVYLGHCKEDGDMFALYRNGYIHFYKGMLNSGKY